MLLILSDQQDACVKLLLPELKDRGVDYLWFDPAHFPIRAQIDVAFCGNGRPSLTLWYEGQTHDLGRTTTVWDRRPGASTIAAQVADPTHRAYVELQNQHFLDGLWSLLDCRWFPGPPLAQRLGGNKIANLARAAEIGFVVPQTLMTNSPQTFTEFYHTCRSQLVSKQFAYRNLFRNGGAYSYAVYTTAVHRRAMANFQSVRYGPVIFQRYVPKLTELRITVVGGQAFAAQIDSQSSRHTRDDCRHYDDNRVGYAAHTLPEAIVQRCVQLVRSFGLTFGAIDMILTPSAEYVFLELNVNGEWTGVAKMAGLPVAEAMIDWLVLSTRGSA